MTAREYLFSLEQIGIKLGLDQIRLLLLALDCPDLAFPSIVVAGTNGKGSVTAMIERGLRDAGYRTGRYTSPHLTHIEERVAIDGAPLSADSFDRLAARIRQAAAALPFPPSFFEATTALALEAFRDAKVDVVVLEVGLGGRLDATNAVTPVLSVITSIDMDHQQYLGNSIEQIAAEKAGIIKSGVSTVLGSNTDQVRAVIRHVAAAQDAPLVYAPDGVDARAELIDGITLATLTTPAGRMGPLRLGLRGRHQVDNAITALCALETLDAGGRLRVPAAARQAALERVEWPARLELRQWRHQGVSHDVLIDGAHNPAGAQALARYLIEAFDRPLPVVFGAMQDKDVDGLVHALAPRASLFICTAAESPRAAQPEVLAARVHHAAPHLTVHTASTPGAALAIAAASGQPIVVAGSLYLAGEIRELLS
jgi:dihydrofolate synthase/folylpolyglutamate synthase